MSIEFDLSGQNYLHFMIVLVATPKPPYPDPFISLRYLFELIQHIDDTLTKINDKLFKLSFQLVVTFAQFDFWVMIYKLDYDFTWNSIFTSILSIKLIQFCRLIVFY